MHTEAYSKLTTKLIHPCIPWWFYFSGAANTSRCFLTSFVGQPKYVGFLTVNSFIDDSCRSALISSPGLFVCLRNNHVPIHKRKIQRPPPGTTSGLLRDCPGWYSINGIDWRQIPSGTVQQSQLLPSLTGVYVNITFYIGLPYNETT